MTLPSPQIRLQSIVVGEPGSAWSDAGFTVDDDVVGIGAVAVHCAGDGGTPSRWSLTGVDGLATLDGIAVIPAREVSDTTRAQTLSTDHPNRVVDLDHVVLRSPDLDRTTAMLENQGIECRRIRDVPMGDTPIQQRFFRIPTGSTADARTSTIIELVGTPEPTTGGPATIWGLACVVDDIDAAATELGPVCSAPRTAVQPGRRIATIRTRDLGIHLTLALMTPRV